jgi:hypothetical protein
MPFPRDARAPPLSLKLLDGVRGWDSRRVRRSLAARTHRVCGLPSHGVPLALIATVAAGQCRTTDLYRLGGHSGSARGGKHDCAVAKPQVTDPGLRRVKFVRMFEFMPLNSAPGRIRTCAHGPGEGLLCTPLTSGNEFRHTRSGGVSGGSPTCSAEDRCLGVQSGLWGPLAALSRMADPEREMRLPGCDRALVGAGGCAGSCSVVTTMLARL